MADIVGEEPESGLTAIVAHGLLNAVSTARAAVTTVRLHSEQLSPARRDEILGRAEATLAFVAESLADLVRGLPPGASDVLDRLDRLERVDPTQH